MIAASTAPDTEPIPPRTTMMTMSKDFTKPRSAAARVVPTSWA